MKIKLTCIKDSETGELGLVLADMRRLDMPSAAIEGLQIAHDILEHVNGPREIGGIGDELEALGVVWHVRGQFADLNRDRQSIYSPEENLASDVMRMARDYNFGAEFERPIPRTKALPGFDETIEDIINHARADLVSEIDHEDRNEKRIAEYFAAVPHFMRAGLRKARRKYPSATAANSLFWNIAEAVTPCAKRCEYEGAEYVLTVTRDGEAHCDEYYAE